MDQTSEVDSLLDRRNLFVLHLFVLLDFDITVVILVGTSITKAAHVVGIGWFSLELSTKGLFEVLGLRHVGECKATGTWIHIVHHGAI